MAAVLTFRLRRKLVKIHMSRRHDKAPDFLRREIARHSKTDPENVKLSTDINRYLQANSTNKFRPIKVSINKTGETVEAVLADELKKTLPSQEQKVAAAVKKEEKKDAKTAEKKQEVKKEEKKDEKKPAQKDAKPGAQAAPKQEKKQAQQPAAKPADQGAAQTQQ